VPSRHVAAVDAYPELKGLSQSEALELAGTLSQLPEEDSGAEWLTPPPPTPYNPCNGGPPPAFSVAS
jgi:hypothetical protein